MLNDYYVVPTGLYVFVVDNSSINISSLTGFAKRNQLLKSPFRGEIFIERNQSKTIIPLGTEYL